MGYSPLSQDLNQVVLLPVSIKKQTDIGYSSADATHVALAHSQA